MTPATTGILATDLDGTLIPLEGNEANRKDLRQLTEEIDRHRVPLLFVTGRHFESVTAVMDQHRLPEPDWVICDVGTSIYERNDSGKFAIVNSYYQHLRDRIASLSIKQLQKELEPIPELRLQEAEKQGPYKLSFYTVSEILDDAVRSVQRRLDDIDAPYSMIASIDPFTNDGLVDLLPRNVSKAYALAWWVDHTKLSPDAIVFAGDSGNDVAALTAGYRAIVVANADKKVAEAVRESHLRAGWSGRLHIARCEATSGVLEGCRQFGLF
jgi:HAD superfamily hydrolase (TIGR01484 family)